MKKALPFVLIFILGFGVLQGQVTKSVSLTTAGTLSEFLSAEEIGTVTHLTITGKMNAEDFSTIRQMTALDYVNLSSASIQGDSVPDYAMEYKYGIDSIDLPSSIVHIGNSAFRDNGLKKLRLPESLVSIGENAFTWSYSLDSISLPQHVVSIGSMAFSYCKLVKTFSFPASLKDIGDWALLSCDSVEEIILDPLNPYFKVEDGALFNAAKSKIILFPARSPIINYTVPSSVDTIDEYAFNGNSILYTLNIPSSVVQIGSSAFDETDSLKAFTVDPENPAFLSEEGVLFNKQKDILIKYPQNKLGHYVVPSAVKYIEMEAFANGRINSIVLPEGLKIIGQSAFSECNNLISLDIPDSTYMGYAAVYGCQRLTSINLPIIDQIQPWDFGFCKSLKSLNIPATVTSIGESAFYGCDSLKSIIIPGFVTSISQYAFLYCPMLDSIVIYSSDPVELSEQSMYFPQEIFSTCTLYVPQGSGSTYSAAPVWKNFSVEEFPCSMEVSAGELQVGYESGSTAKFAITSNTAWKIESDQNWLSIDKTMGIYSDSIVLRADANPENTSRSAVITVSGGGTTPFTIAVTQEAGVLVITRFYNEEIIAIRYNPVTANIVIRNATNLSAKVYDIRGGIVLTREIASDNDYLDVSGLTGGVYIIKVEGKVLKFVK